MIRFAENLNKMIDAGLGGPLDPPRTEVAVGHCIRYLEASGPVASFETNVIAPLKKLIVSMLPVQAGSGDPSPENVRPITGRDSVTVYRTGKNLLDPSAVEIGSYGINGAPLEDGNTVYRRFAITLAPGTYTLSSTVGNMVAIRIVINNITITGTAQSFPVTLTISENSIVKIPMRKSDSSQITEDISFQVEAGSTPTAFAPYKGSQSVEISLGQTVYGGTLDVLAGTLMSEWANIASYNGETLPGEWLSDRDVYVPDTTPTIGAQVCYKLAEPQIIQLTPAELSTLVGDNTVWSDAGDVDVTYQYYEETEGY